MILILSLYKVYFEIDQIFETLDGAWILEKI
jgi:hypothetical protein